MEPVVAFLEGQGLSVRQVAAVVTEHPPVLSYSIPDRLSPLMSYLDTVGVQDVPKVCPLFLCRMIPLLILPSLLFTFGRDVLESESFIRMIWSNQSAIVGVELMQVSHACR